MLFSGKENIFKCFVAFQKMFWKIFSDVLLCSWKYHRKHIFYLLVTLSHIFSATKQIYNIIHSSIQKHKQNPEKNIIKSGQIKRRRKRERRLGSTKGEIARRRQRQDHATQCCNHDRREGEMAIDAILRRSNSIQKGKGDRERERSAARTENSTSRSRCCVWGWAAASVSRSFSLSFSLCTSVSSFLCTSQFQKWFEGKIKTEMLLQDQRTYFTVNRSYFPFDPIFRTNLTAYFTEKHFLN